MLFVWAEARQHFKKADAQHSIGAVSVVELHAHVDCVLTHMDTLTKTQIGLHLGLHNNTHAHTHAHTSLNLCRSRLTPLHGNATKWTKVPLL